MSPSTFLPYFGLILSFFGVAFQGTSWDVLGFILGMLSGSFLVFTLYGLRDSPKAILALNFLNTFLLPKETCSSTSSSASTGQSSSG